MADVYGNRQLLLWLLSFLVIGSIACFLSTNLTCLRLAVFIVALGVGAISGIGNILIFDGYTNIMKIARTLSFSSILVIWAPH